MSSRTLGKRFRGAPGSLDCQCGRRRQHRRLTSHSLVIPRPRGRMSAFADGGLGIHEFLSACTKSVESNSWMPRPSLGMTTERAEMAERNGRQHDLRKSFGRSPCEERPSFSYAVQRELRLRRLFGAGGGQFGLGQQLVEVGLRLVFGLLGHETPGLFLRRRFVFRLRDVGSDLTITSGCRATRTSCRPRVLIGLSSFT